MQINSLSDNPKHRVKQQKVASVPPPAPKPAPPRGPSYRYFSTTPTTVTLRMRDLQIPEKARTPGYNSEAFIDLPCADIFRGAVPKILLSRLAELAPDSVTAKNLPDEGVKVCAARLALAYVVTEGREIIPEPVPSEIPPAAIVPPSLEEFAPPSASTKKDSEPGPTDKKTLPAKEIETSSEPKGIVAKSPGLAPKEEKKVSAELPKPPEPAVGKIILTPEPSAEKPPESVPSAAVPPPRIPPIPKLPTPGPSPASAATPAPTTDGPSGKAESEPEAAEPPPAAVPAKKPFSLFPMFRRKEASENKPSVAVPRGRIEIPKPKRPASPLTDSPAEETPQASPEPPALKEFKPPIPKPRFEPGKNFEPKIVPAVPPPPVVPVAPPREPAEQPPVQKTGETPASASEVPAPAHLKETSGQTEPLPVSAAEAPPAPKASEPEAPKMPNLPSFAPKGPSRFVERMRAAQAASEPEFKPETESPPQPPVEDSIKSEKTEEPVFPVDDAKLPPPAVPELPLPPAPEIQAPAPSEPAASLPKEPETATPQAAKPAEKPVEEAVKPTPTAVPAPGAESNAPAVLVETEHLSKKDAPPEIAEQDALQAIFLTEEFLSVDRVLELCGKLPGIHSCILSQGASVIASHNAPDTVDIVSLSAHALEMLKAMRASSAKMGIGAVPAVTVHSEKGPITFFHQDDICLLVLHKDRGFIPGVREKLQGVVDELAKAKLPLRLGGGESKKLPGK